MKIKFLSVLLSVLFLAGASFSTAQAQVEISQTPYITPTLALFDECLNIDGIQTEVPEGYQTDNELVCTLLPLCDPQEEVQGPCVTPTPTQVPPPPNSGGPGDGRSDGRSDGGSSCPSCTSAPTGNVLGASTATLGATGSNGQLARMLVAAFSAFGIFLLGNALVRDNKYL